jgi:hypothetical protein
MRRSGCPGYSGGHTADTEPSLRRREPPDAAPQQARQQPARVLVVAQQRVPEAQSAAQPAQSRRAANPTAAQREALLELEPLARVSAVQTA